MTLLFQVGVTGHRADRLAMADRFEVKRAVSHVLSTVRESVLAEARERSETASLRVLSSLAEGSDRLIAESGLALGYELHAPLPLDAADFERDFATAESRAAFHALIARAREAFVVPDDVRHVVALERPREAAYERAGRYVVQFSDVLITIWDGEELRGRGGTAQMVDEAIDRALPIVWIPLAEPTRVRVRSADGETDDPDAISRIVRSVLSTR